MVEEFETAEQPCNNIHVYSIVRRNKEGELDVCHLKTVPHVKQNDVLLQKAWCSMKQPPSSTVKDYEYFNSEYTQERTFTVDHSEDSKIRA